MSEIVLIYYSSKVSLPKASLDELQKKILSFFPSIESISEITLCYYKDDQAFEIYNQSSLDTYFSHYSSTPCYILNKAYEEQCLHTINSNQDKISSLQNEFINQLAPSSKDNEIQKQFLENIEANCFTYDSFEKIFNNDLIAVFSPVLQLSTVDTFQASDIVHEGRYCNVCKVEPIVGVMYLCKVCCAKKKGFAVCMDCEVRYRDTNCYHPHNLTYIDKPTQDKLIEINSQLRSSLSITQSTILNSANLKEQCQNVIYNPKEMTGFKVKITIPSEIKDYGIELSSDKTSPNSIHCISLNKIFTAEDGNQEKEVQVKFFNSKEIYPGRYVYILVIKKTSAKFVYETIKVNVNVNLESKLILSD